MSILCVRSLTLYLAFLALDIFPDCPNITSRCSQALQLPCRATAHGNVGYGERLTARHLPEQVAKGDREGTPSAEAAVGNLRLVPCWREWEDLMASWEGEITKELSRRKRF